MQPRLRLSRLSFRWQIILLGTLAFALFLAVLFATFSAFGYAKPAVLQAEENHLWEITRNLAREYADANAIAQKNGQSSPLENPAAESSQQTLVLLSRSVLRGSEDVRGGFYSSVNDALTGSFFPEWDQNEDDLRKDGLALSAQVAVARVARDAALNHRPSEKVEATASGIVLVQAVPLHDNLNYAGSAWTMERLPGLPGSNRFRAYVILVVLGIAALACVILTLLVVRNLQHGVKKIEGGLENLEMNLASQIPPANDPDEIQRITQAINRLGTTLKRNIQREKQIEEQLRHSERLAALGRLVAGVAHEVRNPLATIRLRVQMCQQAGGSQVGESCVIALKEITRLDEMVNRLLSFGQPMHLHKAVANISRLIQQRLENFGEKARTHCVTIVTRFEDEGRLLEVDHSRMAQVFDNLIQNAIDAMPESGGTLWISTGIRAGTLKTEQAFIEFRDSGKGISPDAISRIFDPFFTTKASGTGIGLSICHELVHAHGGSIQVQSEPGRGTTVRITLPLEKTMGEKALATSSKYQ